MKLWLSLAYVLAAVGVAPAHAEKNVPLTAMPEALEVRYALSALPPALRDAASVYVVDPEKGPRLARQGNSGVACMVQRTVWEMGEFRDDIFIPLCYDAAGAGTYLKAIIHAEQQRAQGTDAATLKTRMAAGFRDGTHRLPGKGGVSYMIAPVMRTVGPPDMKIHTMAMPHLMFYAPGVTNADLGAKPDLADPSSLQWPFIDRQGIDEQSYIIQMVGAAEKARIGIEEKALVDALCSWRDVLCLEHAQH